ncbi:MAG: hypothetical protein ABSB97_02165 [Thermoplasmata archaeon]|jgi:hypothetical protein
MTESPSSRTDARVITDRKLDTKTVEVLALAVFRTMFREGIRVPIKMNGMMDLDLVVKDNNVLVNLNQVQAEVPELSIWRITFAYRGKPVVEYGRGIKNDVKFHFPQMCFLLLAIWREKRKKNKAKALGDAHRAENMLTMSVSGPTPVPVEETAV